MRDTARESKGGRSANKQAENGFYGLGIAPSLIKEIDRFNFANPTPIQKEAIPAGIRGDDIIAIARTGSGKTIAYGVPMLQRLSKTKKGAGLVSGCAVEVVVEQLSAVYRWLLGRNAPPEWVHLD